MSSAVLLRLLVWATVTVITSVAVATFARAFIQVKCVESGRPLLHDAADVLAGVLVASLPTVSYWLTTRMVGWNVPVLLLLGVTLAAFVIGAYLSPPEDGYLRARLLYHEHDDPDEDWTEAYARGEAWENELAGGGHDE